MPDTRYIIWRNTQAGILESALRHQYLALTDEAIQISPRENADRQWRMVGSSRLTPEKIESILNAAAGMLAVFKAQGLAAPGDTLDQYLILTDAVPEWWRDFDHGDT